jgi:quercetin dioxygenase-like cupin family protein
MGEQTLDLSKSAQELADLITIQPGAVVSRVLVNKPAGTVTLFAFDAGEGLSEHTAPFDALVHVLEGQAGIRIALDDHEVKAGQVLLLPAGFPHALRAHTSFKMLLTMIRA